MYACVSGLCTWAVEAGCWISLGALIYLELCYRLVVLLGHMCLGCVMGFDISGLVYNMKKYFTLVLFYI